MPCSSVGIVTTFSEKTPLSSGLKCKLKENQAEENSFIYV
jgi:hypothetical protein